MAMATKVYQLRLQRKLSQAELAVRAGVTQGVISRLETHDDYNVSAAALKGLAMALGCTTDYLGDFRERFYCDRVCVPRCSSGYGKPSLFREVRWRVCKTQRWNPISLFVRPRSPMYAWQPPK